MKLKNHETLNFNNKMSTAAVFLDIKKAFETTWYLGLLLNYNFQISLIKLLGSFLSLKISRVSVEGEISTPIDIQLGMPEDSVLSPALCSPYISDTPQTPGVYLGLFADDTCIYATDCKKVMFSESCSEFSVQLRCDVSTGT
jgi:hypothetical protein